MLLKNFINTKTGTIVISIIWGLGLACLFRKVCNDRDCIEYKAPNINYVKNTIWKFNNKCYKYDTKTVKCNKNPIR